MSTSFVRQLLEQYSEPTSYIHSQTVQVKKPTSLSDVFGIVNLVQPWKSKNTADLLVFHPAAVWLNLSVDIYPLAGIYGRMCTFYGGWGASGGKIPASVSDMLALHGATMKSFGGTGDPGTMSVHSICPFNDTMADVLKAPYNDGVRPVYYYCFVELALVTVLLPFSPATPPSTFYTPRRRVYGKTGFDKSYQIYPDPLSDILLYRPGALIAQSFSSFCLRYYTFVALSPRFFPAFSRFSRFYRVST